MKVNQIDISKDMKVSDLVAQFEASDVLGAGRVARATNILANMIKDEDTNVFMSLGGPLILWWDEKYCFSNDKGKVMWI